MKKTLCALLLIMALLVTLPAALADEEDSVLTVSGTGVVTLIPDYATLNLGVSAQASTVSEAQSQSAAQMTKLLEALKAMGIKDEDIQTSYFSINPIYDYSSMGSSEQVTGYRVDNSLSVTVRVLDDVSRVLDGAMAAGANQSYGLTFESTRRAEAYDQALQMAVQEAARKAELMAAATGKELRGLKAVTEQTGGYRGEYVMSAKMMDGATGGTPIMAGTLTVEATVQSVYYLK